MKKICIALLVISPVFAPAQLLKKLGDKVKSKVEKTTDKVDKKVDQSTDAAINKSGSDSKTTDPSNTESTVESNTGKTTSTGIKAYSKYDFIPGEKIIGFEDFSTGSIGDFPAGWNTTGSGEIVTVEGKPGRWLWITKPGVFVPEFTDKYPEDFTFEFDLLHGVPIKGAQFQFVMAELQDVTQPQNWSLASNRYTLGLFTSDSEQKEGTTSSDIRKQSVSQSKNQFNSALLSDKYNPIHVSIWRQKERLRIYVNQEKLWDVPKAIAAEAKLNAMLFYVLYAEANVQHYISNLRLAVGAPDTRNKMLTQNKWVTHGILFDVNSASIKPESFGTLKEMANVLKEYPELKVKIVGHTDADGKDADNLDLSKRRAGSVKESLAKEFGIDESRLETDGKGEGEPMDKNDSPSGKANNRRVEFIKM